MGLRARLTCTLRTACWRASATLARSMPTWRHASSASSQVRFWCSSWKVCCLTWKGSVEMLGASGLSGNVAAKKNRFVVLCVLLVFCYLHESVCASCVCVISMCAVCSVCVPCVCVLCTCIVCVCTRVVCVCVYLRSTGRRTESSRQSRRCSPRCPGWRSRGRWGRTRTGPGCLGPGSTHTHTRNTGSKTTQGDRVQLSG